MAKHTKKAIQNFKRFHGKSPRRLSSFEFTMPRAVTYLGALRSIKYSSSKLDPRKRDRSVDYIYEHKVGSGVKIYLHPNGRALIITGGRFRVTDWMRG